MKKIPPAVVLAALFSFSSLLSPLYAQDGFIDNADLDTLHAREEFRLGVQAFNRFAFNEAIRSFERALAFRPGVPLILDWLGRAYYRSGLEDIGLRQWQAAASGYGYSTGPAMLLSSHIETVRNRRGFIPTEEASGRYPSKNDDLVLYRQPTSVLPQEDGSSWVVAYGSNEIVRINVNGLIVQRERGPLNGFDRPYDLVRGLDGRMYLSEYRGGRVSVLDSQGRWQSYIGSKGRGPGQFVGPQNLTIDDEGYLYVVDYGNQRISKFDPSGTFIMNFGAKSREFQGLLSPTGIAAQNGRVFVADNLSKQIYAFDRNGAFYGVLIREGLTSPESLRFLPDNKLLAADGNRILLVDPDSAVVRELGVLGNPSRVRIAGAGMDRNGTVLAADFKTGEVALMTRMEDMASGLFVQIERIVPDKFPQITVEVQVQDRMRRPMVGLEHGNFVLTEQGMSVADQTLVGAAYRSSSSAISVLLERSGDTMILRDELASAVRDINAATDNMVSLISAGERPERERLDAVPGASSLPERRLEAAARGSAGSFSSRWRFDLGLRLAATDLLPGEKKRAVVFVGSGSLGEMAFEQYSLSEMAAYLANNAVIFYAVLIGNAPASGELRYLCEQTGGQILPLYRTEGIGPVLKSLVQEANGLYNLSFVPADGFWPGLSPPGG